MRRLVVCGCPGSGKSTLARRLGQRLALPVVHLDTLFWRPGWQPSDIGSFRARVTEAIAGDAWISEGDFADASFDLRLPRADAIIIIERSRWLCLVRMIWRALSERTRPDLPEGCAELPDWALVTGIWNYPKDGRRRVEAARVAHGPKVPLIRLRNDREISAFLASHGAGGGQGFGDTAAHRHP
jgi:adenylate kinase family enzyme